jgi:diphosphomevalonate decarboxylase
MLDLIKGKAYERKFKEVNAETWEKYKFQIKSNNSFPTASGMASSASGLACLSVALDALFDHILTQSELS